VTLEDLTRLDEDVMRDASGSSSGGASKKLLALDGVKTEAVYK
jgi:hypothetical protein